MRDLCADTSVRGGDGRYTATLHEEWSVWGPFGGYRAAILLRACAAASPQPRPATFACTYLSTGKPGAVEIEVTTRQAGKRAVALQACMTQAGAPVTDATAWFIAEGIEGFEHDVAVMPPAPPAEALRPYQELAENYAEWYPFWRNVEGRPLGWDGGIGPPEYRAWFRLLRPLPAAADAVLDAARQLVWLDTMMWNAVPPPHGWPARYIAPSLDLTAQFHAFDPAAEFLLADAAAPVARDGLASCNGRVWSPSGRLLATGTSQLLCRPAPRS